MKKAVYIATALMLSFGALSCSQKSGNPAEEIVEVIDEATQKVKNAKDAAEAKEIAVETGKKISEISEKYPDYEATDAEKQKLNEATKRFVEANVEKTFKAIPKDELESAANKINDESGK